MSDRKDYDILIIGELCGNDLVAAENLSRKGLKCCVLRRKDSKNNSQNICALNGFHQFFKESDVILYTPGLEFLKIAWRSRLILSFTSALIGASKAKL